MTIELKPDVKDMKVHEVKAVVDYLDDYLYLLNRKLEVHFEKVYADSIAPAIQQVFDECGIRLEELTYQYDNMNASTVYARLEHAGDWPAVDRLNLIDKVNDAIQANETDVHVYYFVLG